ncbi:MAG: hypothetical protein JWQ07_3724 [Ramlibacter sp.]|nr:hypothetical protein [Ramlibacter sp.]
MKAYYLLAPLGVALLAGCTVYRPVAYEPAYTTPATVAVVPQTYVAPNTVVMGAAPANWGQIDSDGDGYANSVDRYPYDARWH